MILCSLCDFPDCGENGQKPVMFPTFGDTLPSSGLHLALSATATRLQLGGPAMLAASAAATLSPVPDRCTVCAQTVHVTDTVQGRGEPGGGGVGDGPNGGRDGWLRGWDRAEARRTVMILDYWCIGQATETHQSRTNIHTVIAWIGLFG